MTAQDQKFALYCSIITGMLANTNGGDAVWGNAQSQRNLLTLAQQMAEMAFPTEIAVDSVQTPAPVDATAEEVATDTSQAA